MPSDPPIRVFCEDESRFGLIPVIRRRITLPGVKPKSPVRFQFESYYLYGAIEPLTGEHFFLELSHLDATCFQVFLKHFADAYSESLNVLLVDQGGLHQAQSLKIPDNVRLLSLPAYSPELNPMERFWEYLKDLIANQLFGTLEQLQDTVAGHLRQLVQAEVQSLTAYPFLIKAINDAF